MLAPRPVSTKDNARGVPLRRQKLRQADGRFCGRAAFSSRVAERIRLADLPGRRAAIQVTGQNVLSVIEPVFQLGHRFRRTKKLIRAA